MNTGRFAVKESLVCLGEWSRSAINYCVAAIGVDTNGPGCEWTLVVGGGQVPWNVLFSSVCKLFSLLMQMTKMVD